MKTQEVLTSMKNSPLRRTTYDKISWTITIVVLLSTFIPFLFYDKFADKEVIPLHFNARGEIDNWGTRSYLWFFSLAAFVLYVIISFCERNYKKFNFPIKITNENSVEMYRYSVLLIRHLKILFMLVFAYLNNASLVVILGNETWINSYLQNGVCILIFVFGLTLYYYFKMLTCKNRFHFSES